MALLSEQIIESVRSKADIVDTVSSYVQLKKRGRNYFGICPFHDEKTPSFSVNQDKQIYKCFGCGAGGGSINFIMDIEKLDFIEAIKYLGEQHGVEIKLNDRNKDSSLLSQLFDINEFSSNYYMENLFDEKNIQVLEHLKKRGLTNETIRLFKLGYANDSYDDLLKTIQKQEYNPNAMKQSGLFIDTKKGYIDRFRSRITFTINNASGKVVAFAGRVYKSNDIAKYVNSPETPLYIKSNVLYGLDKTKNDIIKSSCAIIVEGYLDLLQLYQSGIKNVVAISGTSLTDQHAKMIKRYCNNIYLAYDGDNAGISAAIKASFILMKNNLSVKILSIPNDKDPDDWVRDDGIEPFKNALKNSLETIEFQYKHKGISNSSFDLSQFINSIINELSQIDDPIVQELQCKILAKISNISETNILKKLENINNANKTKPKNKIKNNTDMKSENVRLVEEELIKLCFEPDIEVRKLINNRINLDWLTNDSIKKIFSVTSIHLTSKSHPNPSILMNELDEKERKMLAELIINSNELIDVNINMAIDCLNRLEKFSLKNKLNTLRENLKMKIDEDQEKNTLIKITEIQNQLNQLI